MPAIVESRKHPDSPVHVFARGCGRTWRQESEVVAPELPLCIELYYIASVYQSGRKPNETWKHLVSAQALNPLCSLHAMRFIANFRLNLGFQCI